MDGTVRIGLGGWNYPEWKDGLYKGMPRRAWLARAAGTFDTLEVNATLYRSTKSSTYDKWRGETPAASRFALKGSRHVAHYGGLKDPRAAAARDARR